MRRRNYNDKKTLLSCSIIIFIDKDKRKINSSPIFWYMNELIDNDINH